MIILALIVFSIVVWQSKNLPRNAGLPNTACRRTWAACIAIRAIFVYFVGAGLSWLSSPAQSANACRRCYMDKFDLLVKLHQIRTSAVDENNQGLRDFIDEIFSSLASDDFDKYDERFSETIAHLTPRAPDRLRRSLRARLGKFLVQLGYLLARNGGRQRQPFGQVFHKRR